MTASISSLPAFGVSPDANRGDASVELRNKLEHCKRQLGDWEGCESRKTPEGKKIIEKLKTQIDTIESRLVAKADAPTPSVTPQQRIQGDADSAPPPVAQNAISTLGSQVDVFV